MVPATTSGRIPIHYLDDRLHYQVIHTERKSPPAPTTLNSRLGIHGHDRDVLGYPNNSNTLLSLSEHLHEYNKSELRRHRLDVEGFDTHGKALKHPNRSTKISPTEPASSMWHPQQLKDSRCQVSNLHMSEVGRKITTFQFQNHPDRCLYAPVESEYEQLNPYLDNEKRADQQHVDCCKHEGIPGLDHYLTPDQVYVDASRFGLAPALGRELKLNFGFNSGPELTLLSDPDAMYEKLVCSDPVNIEPLQRAPSAMKSNPIRSTRSEPGSSHNRRCRSAQARAQLMRDRSCRSASVPIEQYTMASAGNFSLFTSAELRPKRKHCTFVQEQELTCLFEDRVGTPHLSERQPGDDVNAQLNVDELSVGGEVAALSIEDEATQGLTAFAITDIPNEELSLG